MKRGFVALLSCLVVVGIISSCAGSKGALMEPDTTKSIAVVSLSVNNYGNQLGGWDLEKNKLIWKVVDDMLSQTEKKLGMKWNVISAPEFATKPEFQSLAGTELDVAVPTIEGKQFPLFAADRKQLVRTEISPDKVIELAKITGADFLVVIYTEWGVATGKMVPTSKALTKNVVSVYNSMGEVVYQRRHDQIGEKTLGALAQVTVNEETIQQWVNSYMMGINTIF